MPPKLDWPYTKASLGDKPRVLFEELVRFASSKIILEEGEVHPPVIERPLDEDGNPCDEYDRHILCRFINGMDDRYKPEFKRLMGPWLKRWQKAASADEGVTNGYVEHAFGAFAQARKTPLIDSMAEFLEYCRDPERKYELNSTKNIIYRNIADELLAARAEQNVAAKRHHVAEQPAAPHRPAPTVAASFQLVASKYWKGPSDRQFVALLAWIDGQRFTVAQTHISEQGRYQINLRYDAANQSPNHW